MTTFQIIGVIFMAVCAVGIIYSLRKGDKSRYHYLLLTLVMVASGQSAFAQTTWSLQPTSSGNTITYKVKRSGDISKTVTVRYRTVGLSSYEGENFTSANGTLTFPAGIDQQIVTVTTQTPSTEAYKYYQSGAARKYLFEVTDMGGFTLLSREDNAGAGTVFNTSYLNQSVTDLVYFNSNGAIKSGDGNKYVDASYSSSSWVQVTDGGYSQAVHTISTNNLYSNNSSATSFRSYLNEIGYNMYATVYFTQMEEQDGYQYIQILADNSSTYDGNDPNGAVNAPSTSLYKACFILSYDPSGSVMSDAHYQFFPHRYDYVDMAAEQTAGITHYEFDYDNSHLYQQKFRTTSYQASTSGSLVLAPTVNNLNVRFDAAGSGGDTWDFKNLKVRLALVDATKPKIRNNNDIRVADGAYGYGNTVYITIPFTEIVTVTGNPTLSTTWGELNYLAGSGTNVLTFSGHIEADLGTVLTINSIGGTSFTIKDLMGNTYNNTSINKTYSGLQVTNPWAGSGTANDPYIIMDSYQLNLLSKLVWAGNYYENKYFKLGANITYSSSTSWSSTSSFTSNFTSIGGWGHSFRGIFDGDGHSISGIRIYKSGSSTDDECQGLFGYASSATIKNLVLYNVNIVGYKQVGAIAGSQTYGTFQDCYIYNTRVAATSGTQQEVIAGSISGGTRDRIYFKNCKIGNNTGQHNIVKLTLTNDATVTRTPVTTVNSTLTTYSDGATISGEEYYSPDATITLGYSGSVSSGSFVKYTASTSTGDITFTNIDGSVLTMPDADVTVSAAILPEVTYLDANGDAHQCSDYTLITSSTSNVEMGASGKTHWYVVSSDATINAMLKFTDATANLILCNGATLNVNRTNSGSAVFANNLNIFGQTNGNGTLNATVSNGSGISSNALGIYGGIVSASGGDYGINAGGNSITLGYTAAANRVTASSYLCNSLTVKAGQTLTDGEGHIYSGTYTGNDLNSTLTAMATKTLQPAYSLTLPDHFTVTGTTAPQGFAPAGETVTLHTDEGYTITAASYTPEGGSATTITPVEGVWSFTMPTANTTVSATRIINTYTVHFDANATNGIDVTGTMEDMDFTYGQAQNLTTNDFERTGYNFDGWNTAADGSGDAYTDGQNVNNLTNVLNGVVTLYAQWSIIPWQGNGTSENDPYIIIYASQLVKLSEDVNGGNGYSNKFFKLGNDINMSGVAFDGISSSSARSFGGTFNGDGKTVSNVIVNKSEQNYVGFFGYVYYGTVRNLILDGVSITGYTYVGDLVGYGKSCSIENCLVMNSSVTCTNTSIGVICGYLNNATLTYNHYRNCTLTKGNQTSTINIGIGNFSSGSSDVDGARSIHTLALPEHVTAISADMLTYDNVTYYASNVEVTLTPAQGITLADVTVNGVAATHQQDETWTFTMPAADATVTCTSSVPYIDADGNQQTCSSYTVIDGSQNSYGTSGQTGWYVVSGDVTLNNNTEALKLQGSDNYLILCDGAKLTLNSTGSSGLFVNGNLTIFVQESGTGSIEAVSHMASIKVQHNCTINGGNFDLEGANSGGLHIYQGILTINGGTVIATSTYANAIHTQKVGSDVIINGGIVNVTTQAGGTHHAIKAEGNITLGFTNLTDRITASRYEAYNGTLSVKANQALYDGTAVAYSGTLTNTQINAIAGKTLEPCFILTLPAHVNATGVISQDGTTAYALAGNEITLTVTEGYEITSGAASLTMPTHNVVSDVTVQAIAYSISYDLAGGSVSTANPTEYTIETPDITLNNPTRPQFTFAGWTGTDLSEATLNVTIAQGSTGPRSYTANWEADIAENWGNGDGSLEAPYVITTTQGLDLLATLVNEGNTYEGKYFELGNDIDYVSNTTANYTAIGTQTRAFAGTFDGKGYAVKNFHIESNTGFQGLFGHVAESGTVKNVMVDNVVINDNAGIRNAGIVGLNWGSVENCLVINTVISGSWPEPIAGFVGTVTNSYYRNCTVGNWANKTNCYTITGDTGVTVAVNNYDYGVTYNGTLYAPEGATVSLNLSYNNVPSGKVPVFISSSGQLSGTGNPYTLYMENYEDVTITAKLGIANVAYLDADGVQQTCPAAQLITSGDSGDEYDPMYYRGQWFVVDGNVNVTPSIRFRDDAHVILKDGATLNTDMMYGSYTLTIYAQSSGDNMGVINATVAAEGLTINGGIINANQDNDSKLSSNIGDLVINSGRITANEIKAAYIEHKSTADIILGWRNNTDFITAGSYSCESGNVKVKAGQILTDGSNAYFGTLTADQVTAIAGQTLVPFQIGWEGNGTANAPYVIDTPEELNTLAMMVNGGENFDDTYFELGANIAYEYTSDWDDTTSEENNFAAIGGGSNNRVFMGIFDGKGYTISGIRIYKNENGQGLFGITLGAVIKNIVLTDTRITSNNSNIGGIVGLNQGTVENCLLINVLVRGNTNYNVIVGNNNDTVTNSYYRNCTVGNSSGQTNCYTVSGGTNVNVVFNSYAYGILYNGTLYAPVETDVSLNLTYTGDVPQGYAPIFLSDNAYYPLNGTSNPYLLRTTNEDITINVELGLADVAYLDANGVQQTCPVARRITSDNSEEYVLYNGQWFVVDDNVTINEGIYFEDDAHLIIKDGATLTTQEIDGRYSLSIYAQSGGDNMGVINATVAAEGLTINGGIINANQVDGSGLHSNRGDLVITSGRITANIIEADYEEHKGIANIILSWRNATDFITSAGYSCENGNVKVWTGRIITDGNNIYWGTLTNDQVTAIAGQTLVPFQATWEGSGTAEDPYIITTPDELDMLAFMVNIGNTYQNTYFELGNDIAYTHTSDWDDTSSDENNYTAIGSLNYCAFLGVFDGKGHAISGIRIYSNEGKQGLFGVTFNAVIRNITLTDTRITTVNEANVGGIVGVNQGTVENCHVTNTVNIHNVPVQVGGIVGLNTTDAIVRGCTSSVRLTIDNENYHGSYGGIVGSLGSGCTIEDCLAIDVINECTNSSGPIVGSDNGTVNNSYYYNCTVGSETNMSDVYAVNHANNVTVAPAGDVFVAYDYDGIAVYDYGYDYGMAYGGTLYAPGYAEVLLTLGYTGDPQTFGGYMASAGTLTGTENPYTLFIPYEDVIISARTSIPYIDANGQTAYCQYYTILNGSEDYISYGDNDVEAWYVVDHDVTYSDGLQFNGSANLILVDGATLTINDDTEGDGGYMSSSDRLTIYVQSNGTGAITAVNSSISASGDLIIHGGHITLSSDNSQAVLWSWGDLTINGGEISIENGEYSCIYVSGQLTINDGTLNAVVTEEDNGYDVIYSEEDVVINGGNITVTNQGYGRGIVGDNVTINGGCVKVYIVEDYGYSGIGVDWWEGEVITLGWTDPSDLIMSQGGYDTYQLSIAPGQAFTDGEGNYFLGTYYNWDEIAALAGKTLRPFTNLDETFHITYVTNGGTLPDGYPTTYTFDETVELHVPTKENNAFAGWFDNAEFEGSPVTEIVAGTTLGDKTFYAKWMPAKTWVEYLDADGQQQRVYATVLYGIETELPGGVYTIVEDDVYFDKLSFTGNTTIILPDYKHLNVEAWGKGTNDDENGLFVNGDLTIYGQEFGDGLLNSFNVQVSGDVAIYGGHLDIGILSANNGSGTITLSWTGWDSSIRVGVYLGKVVLAKAFIDDDDNIHEAGTVADVTPINGQWLYPFITETEVSYLDENGVLQTVTATVLYGGEEAEYPGGVYTVLDMVIRGQAYYDRLHFTGDATIILPDWCSFGVAATKEDNEYWLHVDGDLTIYGQEYGNGQCLFSNVTVNGHVNVYGGWVVLYNISANEINLSWTSIQNEHMVNPTQGTTVNLLKDFMYYDDDNNRHVINAQQNVDITTIAERYLKPYAETIDVSYIDENGDTHTENATVLFGDETSLSGGTYTIINYTSFSQAVSFSGNTKLIIPDGIEVYGYYQGGGINLNVTGDLAIYGQENRSGTVLYINASVSGAVTVSNVRVIYSFINSESDILIAGGEQNYGQLSTNGIITLGYLTFNDQIFCYDYEGTVAIREGLTMINDGNGKTYTGTLTAEEVAAIAGEYLRPYIEPTVTQTIALAEGWNWVSTYIAVDDPVAMLDMLKEGLGDNAEQIQSFYCTTEYDGEEWFGDLDEEGITNDQMYMILVNTPCTVELEGYTAIADQYEITIKPGWNWIGFPNPYPIDVVVAMVNFEADEGDQIQSKYCTTEFDGDEWFGDLEAFEPGEGYLYYSNSSSVKTLILSDEIILIK